MKLFFFGEISEQAERLLWRSGHAVFAQIVSRVFSALTPPQPIPGSTGGGYHKITGVNGLVLSGDQTFDISSGLRVSTVVSVSRTVTFAGKQFVRLKVTPN